MPELLTKSKEPLDRTNAFIAAFVFLASFVVYAMTVQQTLSFWDCGEFIASAYILGIPHPPGFPLFINLGRVFAMIPFVEDVSHRINYISVMGSAFTAMFSYLLTVRIIGYFFNGESHTPLNRLIAYVGGITGAFFVTFGRTNWANSVEAEVYGMALAMMVAMVWLTFRFFEQRGSITGTKSLIFVFYLAMLGVGVHMTVFLVMPILAFFFILGKDASRRDYAILSAFVVIELLLIMLFSTAPGGPPGYKAFFVVTALLGIAVLILLYKHINWGILIGVVAASSVMLSFERWMYITPIGFLVLVVLGLMSEKRGWGLQWKTGLVVIVIAVIGMSVHLFIPIRSDQDPRIDENNPSRDFQTFVSFLDRKQYGQTSMTERMFSRRGLWENQIGRHPHMGFWSYFEEQYGPERWGFVPFFALGLLGMFVAMRKRWEIGMPFFALFLLTTLGLVLYMNFADGTQYDPASGDAYLEVRNRDYFFTPGFVFFGIAMGLGIAAIMKYVKDALSNSGGSTQKLAVYASSILVFLPLTAAAHNWHASDRSENVIPYNYAKNLLDTCEPNALLFTSGDNDTFPLWALQEAYNYRKDVRIINLSLLNTDWYVEQMKNRYDVPIDLTDEQILWHPIPESDGMYVRPRQMFRDRARKRMTYLTPSRTPDGRVVKVQDMMMDEIVISSIDSVNGDTWYLKQPIYFSSQPYAESPLNLSGRAAATGLLYKLEEVPRERNINVDRGYDLYLNTYRYDGYEDSEVYRDENATGVFITVGVNGVRIFDELHRQNRVDSAKTFAHHLIDVYPEYWQTYILLSDIYENEGDTAAGDSLFHLLHDTLTSFLASNPDNLIYMQDLGLAKYELGSRLDDPELKQAGIDLVWKGYEGNPNAGYGFRKLVTVLSQERDFEGIQQAANMFAQYKVNLNDPFLQQILGRGGPPPGTMPGQ